MGVSATGPPQGLGSQLPLEGQGASSECPAESPTLSGSSRKGRLTRRITTTRRNKATINLKVLPSKLNLKRVSAPPSDESETIQVGENSGKHVTKHAPGCITMTGATQGAVRRILVDGHGKSDDSTESPRLQCSLFTDEDTERMKKRIYDLELLNEELELLNADLKQQLEEAEIQLKVNDGFTRPEHNIPDRLNSCHDIFICSNESGYEMLVKKLAHAKSKIIQVVVVHGKQVWKHLEESKEFKVRHHIYVPPQARNKDGSSSENDFRRLTPLGKIILLGIIEDIYRLHRRGFCLDGHFTLESFYWTDEKKIKLDPSLKLIAVGTEGRKSCMINDYHRIHEIVMEILSLCKETASSDLEQLLDLLKCDDPVDVEDIIRYNIFDDGNSKAKPLHNFV